MTSHSRLLEKIPGIRHAFDAPGDPEPEGLARCRQVHGAAIANVDREPAAHFRALEADGLFTREPRLVGIQTADCLPTLFASRDGAAIAAIHAGWRGLHKGILVRAAERFAAQGVPATELVVAIGPAIGGCCFEVSPEVIDAFEKDWGHLWAGAGKPWQKGRPASKRDSRGQAPASDNDLWINLERIARLQLSNYGVPDWQIEDVGHCTYCGPGELASYRRGTHEGVKAGRQWSWIARS
jgi:YfiH family protein